MFRYTQGINLSHASKQLIWRKLQRVNISIKSFHKLYIVLRTLVRANARVALMKSCDKISHLLLPGTPQSYDM